MGKKITIDGRGHATIDCEAVSFGLMPKRGFIMANGETHQSVLQGVKITHCRGGKGGENKRNMYGLHVAYLILVKDSSPQVLHTIIHDSRSHFSGGGIAAQY